MEAMRKMFDDKVADMGISKGINASAVLSGEEYNQILNRIYLCVKSHTLTQLARASPSVVAPRHATAAVASVLRMVSHATAAVTSVLRMVSNATVDVGVVPSVIISLTDRRKRNLGIFVC